MAGPGDGIPGEELVAAGVEALRQGELSIEALLVAVGAPRLRSLGIPVPDDARLPHYPELALYRAVGRRYPDDAHSRCNALIRRLVSFEHELERRRFSAQRSGNMLGLNISCLFRRNCIWLPMTNGKF